MARLIARAPGKSIAGHSMALWVSSISGAPDENYAILTNEPSRLQLTNSCCSPPVLHQAFAALPQMRKKRLN
jgi:hypothetical protein